MTQMTAIPEVIQNPQLVARFEARLMDFNRSLKRLRPEDMTDQSRIDAILTELHKLAGIAALFGERQLGVRAHQYQALLKDAPAIGRPQIIRDMLFTFAKKEQP